MRSPLFFLLFKYQTPGVVQPSTKISAAVIAEAKSETKNKAIAYAVTQPPHVKVNKILIRPTQQEK